jgi:3-phosphoshikimate 1-carboxyvinyltransferase
MSFALAGLKIPGIRIKNPTCVEKSFSDFFDRFKAMYE